jgi:hypothetical protein
MNKFYLEYYYLANGSEGRGDFRAYGIIEADTMSEAKQKLTEREVKNPDDFEFFRSCLSGIQLNKPND